METVRLTVTTANCRSGCHRAGETFFLGEKCPPVCAELWAVAWPYVFALQNGGLLDAGDATARSFDVACPDGGRVRLHGEVVPGGSVGNGQ